MILQSAPASNAADLSRIGLYALYIALVDFGYLIWLTLRVKNGLEKLDRRLVELEKKR